jgi:hypothetical protein
MIDEVLSYMMVAVSLLFLILVVAWHFDINIIPGGET